MVPTLRVVTPVMTLRVMGPARCKRTRSILGCVTTRSVGTICEAFPGYHTTRKSHCVAP